MWRSYLRNVYTDLSKGGSFQGVDKLYHTIKKEGKIKIKKKDIAEFLKGEDTYTLHKEVRRKFRTNRMIAADIDTVWQADLADLSKFQSENEGYRYLLGCIDCFSRKLYVRALKTKTGKEIVQEMKNIFEKCGTKPRTIMSDRGSEFTNNTVSEYLQSHDVGHIYTSNMSQAAVIERVWKTLKMRMMKYFEANMSTRYIDILQSLVVGYNNTYHTSIGMTPNEVNESTYMQAEYNQMVSARKRASPGTLPRHKLGRVYKTRDLVDPLYKRLPQFKFALGAHVRLSLRPEKISNEYKQKWTREIFLVHSRKNRSGIPVYKVKDMKGEVLEGTFYTQELQEVAPEDDNKSYEINKILKERTFTNEKGNQQKEYLVSFVGYPKKFNQWITDAAFTRK